MAKTIMRSTTDTFAARFARSVHVVDGQRVRHAISVSIVMSRCLMLGNGICRRCHVREDSGGYRCHDKQHSQSWSTEETQVKEDRMTVACCTQPQVPTITCQQKLHDSDVCVERISRMITCKQCWQLGQLRLLLLAFQTLSEACATDVIPEN